MMKTNLLSKEEMEILQKNSSLSDMQITQEEVLKSKCQHTDMNGMPTLIEQTNDPNNTLYVCSTCGQTIDVRLYSIEELETYIGNVSNIMQQIKFFYQDVPKDLADHMYTITALLDKVPTLYKIAVDKYKSNSNNQNSIYDNNLQYGTNDIYSVANGFVGAGYNPQMNVYQQPVYGNPQMNGYQQPVYGNPQMNGYQQPVYGNPQMNGYQQPVYGNPQQPNVQPKPNFVNNQQSNNINQNVNNEYSPSNTNTNPFK